MRPVGPRLGSGRGLPYASAGDDAGIIPEPCGGADPKRRAKSPALHCGREREVIRKRQLFARPVGGPMQASAPTQGQAAAPCFVARVRYIVGRAFTPAGETGGGPEGYWQGKVRHPSVGGRRQLPLQGSLLGGPPFAPAQTLASRISPLRKAMSAPAGRSRRARVRRASSGAISTHCTRRLSQVVQYRRRLSAHRTTLYTV